MWSHLRLWSHLLKKSLTENFILCAVQLLQGLSYRFYCADIFKGVLKFGEQKTTMTICMKWVNSLEALQITEKKLNPFFLGGGRTGHERVDRSIRDKS